MRLYKITASTSKNDISPVRIFVGAKAEGVIERKKLAELGFTLKDGGHDYDPSISGVYFSGGDE